MNNRTIGNIGEELACAMLVKRGYKILNRNFMTKHGELDIVAMYEDTLCFIEVKTRLDESYGLGRLAVTRDKRAHLRYAANVFLLGTKVKYKNIEFQVIEIMVSHIKGLSF